LSQPTNFATGVSIAPSFAWQDAFGAISWNLQLSTTESPLGIIHDAFNIEMPSYDLPMILNSNTPYFWRVSASNNCGEGAWSDWWTFRTTDAMTVLLIDDDDNAPDVRDSYIALVESAGLLYDIHDTQNSNNEPTATELQGYQLVIWFTGDEWGGFAGPGTAGETALASYIDAGGYLVLSSQDYLYDNGLTSFGTTHLGIGSFTSDVSQASVTGLDIFDDLGTVSLTYPFTNYSDTVSPSANSATSFVGNVSDAGIIQNGLTGGGAVFLGFPIEAMPTSSKDAFMNGVLAWMGSGSTPCPEDCNGDGFVDVTDLLGIIEGWGSSSGCDVNGDGLIDVIDLLAVVGSWGQCP